MTILTIGICSVLVLFAFTTPLCNGFFRKIKNMRVASSSELPRFSVVMTVHDNASELERNLPLILGQDYKPGFEVIVVDESSTDDTEDVLKRFKKIYSNLYVTFIPESSHYLSRRKLALTVGIKAAKNEWVIFIDADCRPEGYMWLESMAKYCTDNSDLVLGYTNYTDDSPLFCRFERLLTSCYVFRKAQVGIAYRYNGNNLAFRKSVFMSHNGFLRNLKYLRGEYDFIVNEYASKGRAFAVTDKRAMVRQDAPSEKAWINTHLHYMETRKHLKRSIPYRILWNIDTLLLHLNYGIIVLSAAYSMYFHDMFVAVAVLLAFIVTFFARIVIAKKAAGLFDENLPGLAIPFMELRMLWQNIYFLLLHKCSDKYKFIRK